jgi:transposase
MDRASLEQLLAEGLSLAEIGRRFGRHESTVGYWLQRHGLQARGQSKYAARGGIARDELEALVADGMSVAQIAERVSLSRTTVRHWLREFGLTTHWADRRQASAAGEPRVPLRCPHHGVTQFSRRSAGGYRCNRCRAEAVVRRRRKVKRVLVEEAGGACAVCGYSRCVAALHFHHLVPAEKQFSLSQPSRRGQISGEGQVGGEQVRAALLQLPCRGGGWSDRPPGGSFGSRTMITC